MKKVFLLIVLSCLFISCKNHVSSNQGNNQEEELLPTQVKIINYCEGLRINSACAIFSETDLTGDQLIITFPNSTLNYSESKIFDIIEIPDGYIPVSFVCEIENLTTGQIYKDHDCAYRTLFYDYDDRKKNFKIKNNKKIVALSHNGRIVCSEDY